MSGKVLGRRLFAGGAASAPLALGGARNTAMTGKVLGGHTATVAKEAHGAAGIWSIFNKAIRPHDRAKQERVDRRRAMGGLDPDLAVCGSMSRQHRVIRQMEREKAEEEAHETLSAALFRSLGGNPDCL